MSITGKYGHRIHGELSPMKGISRRIRRLPINAGVVTTPNVLLRRAETLHRTHYPRLSEANLGFKNVVSPMFINGSIKNNMSGFLICQYYRSIIDKWLSQRVPALGVFHAI